MRGAVAASAVFVLGVAGLLSASFLLGGCDGGEGVAPSAPAVPAPPPAPAALTAGFVEESVRVVEGETAEIRVRYQVNELESAVRIEVAITEDSVSAEDYELRVGSVEIPGGRETSGAASIELAAVADTLISEGAERLSLRLVAPAGVRVDLGPDLEVTIAEGGASPCPGVTVLAEPPTPLVDGPSHTAVQVLGTTLLMKWLPEAQEARTMFDWIGPYRERPQGEGYSRRWERNRYQAMPEWSVARWGVTRDGVVTRHSIRVEWPEDTELGLRFHAASGVCQAEPEVACGDGGCELRP